ncbi:MAG: TMEM165/GDT1 family protein [Pseudoxanthomonas sp.]
MMLQALWVSAGTVALAEMGDKTQLLTLLLAARFRKPWTIAAGVLASTLINHAISAWLGAELSALLSPRVLRWIVAASFIGVAVWTLVPDTLDENEKLPAHGAFAATLIAFFLAEIGDKTQVATVLLGSRYTPLWQVIGGTTVGMMAANLPAIWLGNRFAGRLPLKPLRLCAALAFLALGVWAAIHGVG